MSMVLVQLFGKVIKEKNEKRKELLEKRPEESYSFYM